MGDREKALKKQIIDIGQRLYKRKLAVASSGNISAKLSDNYILITRAQAQLASLTYSDIIKVDIAKSTDSAESPSSELPLHSLAYQNLKTNIVLHCHPPLANGYFAVNSSLEALTFETRFYLGKVPVIKQTAPTVTQPEEVVNALKVSNLVVLKNHGVIAIGDDFSKALALIETLEAAVKSAAFAEIFKNKKEESLSGEADKRQDEKVYPMFSTEHIEKIVELVNQDKLIAEKGKELGLTVELAIKLKDSDKAYRFSFKEGKVINVSFCADAPFVISADTEVWQDVFLGRLDPFVAVTQGKMDLCGQLGQLSQWYVPFSRLFELFKQVEFKESGIQE